MKNHNKNITDIEKQLAALQGDNSEESLSKRQQLQTQLEEAREAQEEEMYDRWLQDQNRALDDLYTNYETVLNERLDNIDALVSEMIDATNKNSSAIKDTIEKETGKVGYDITEGMKDIWTDGNGSIKNVVSEYNSNFTNTMTTTNGYIQEIRDLIKSSIDNNVSVSHPKNVIGNGFADGGLIGRAIRNAEGINGGFVLAHSGEYILNERQLGIADHMVSNLVNFAKRNGSFAGSYGSSQSSRIDKVEMNISLPNVSNYNEFKDALVRDKQIQNIIQDMTIGNALGKNSLNKYRHK